MYRVFFAILVSVILSLTSCDIRSGSDKVVQKKMDVMLQESNNQLGLPAIKNFQEKKNLKWIYELCDEEKLICHAYLFNSMNGTIGEYLGECIGYGIPYSTQYSNPEKLVDRYGDPIDGVYDAFNIPQAEPNGLFKPVGLSATWLIMIDPETKKPRPVYVEPEIIVSPFKLK